MTSRIIFIVFILLVMLTTYLTGMNNNSCPKLIVLKSANINGTEHWYNSSDMLKAVREHDVKQMHNLLSLDKDLAHITDENNEPILHYAVRYGNTKCMQLLIDSGADVNAKGYLQCRPLHICVNRGFLKKAKILIQHGAHVDDATNCWGATPLLLCDPSNDLQLKIAQLLLTKGANINARDNEGRTFFHMAAQTANLSTIYRLLLDYKVDIHATDRWGENALHKAVKYRRVDIVQFLLLLDADAHLKDNENLTPLEHAWNLPESHEKQIIVKILENK